MKKRNKKEEEKGKWRKKRMRGKRKRRTRKRRRKCFEEDEVERENSVRTYKRESKFKFLFHSYYLDLKTY